MSGRPWTIEEYQDATKQEAQEAERRKFTGSVTITLHYLQGSLGRISVQRTSELRPTPGPARPFRHDGA